MARRVHITTKTLASLKPAPAGQRYAIQDAIVPGLAVRVTDRGSRSYVMTKRWKGRGSNPTCRSLGEVGTLTLIQAREKARSWLVLLQQGLDPQDVDRRAAVVKRQSAANTFGSVAEEYIKRQLVNQRRGARSAQEIRRDVIPTLGNQPIAAITRREVIATVEAIKDRGAHASARIAFGHIRMIFGWAIDRDLYGIESSPADRIRAASILGPKRPRQRVLNDDEVRAVWRAAEKIGYPYGTIVRLLFLTGCRRSEIAEMKWNELDLREKVFTVPPERFKSGSAHIVPLTDDAMTEVLSCPRQTGPFVFSLTAGETPVNSFSRPMAAIKRMVAGEVEVAPWVIHDIRRTVRTRLSALRVPEHIAELVIGHGAGTALTRTYNLHQYRDEIRAALDRWAARLRVIVAVN